MRRMRRGLTLIEILISITIIAILLVVLLTFYLRTMQSRDAAVARADRTQIARQVLDRLAAELRGCVGFDQIRFPVEQRLLGDRRRLSFLTTALPAAHQWEFMSEFEDLPPAQHDLTQVTYWLWVDPDDQGESGEPLIGGIVRTEKKTLNQFLVEEDDPLDVRNDLWSYELGYLEFRYYDGAQWSTVWDAQQGNSLPHLIQVTVGFEPATLDDLEDRDLDEYPIEEWPFGDDFEHEDRYSIIVKIPAADQFFGARFERVGRQMAEDMGVEGLP